MARSTICRFFGGEIIILMGHHGATVGILKVEVQDYGGFGPYW